MQLMIKDPDMGTWDFTVVDKNDKSISTLPDGQENLITNLFKNFHDKHEFLSCQYNIENTYIHIYKSSDIILHSETKI